ncbi:MAG TPA: hypothetical protein PLJ27_20460, partial [Polyangiaceae bacterium]|nr:hypothetical protein [Polyangiaceae bacterium]
MRRRRKASAIRDRARAVHGFDVLAPTRHEQPPSSSVSPGGGVVSAASVVSASATESCVASEVL